MRTAIPNSLLLVTIVYSGPKDVVVLGPFSSVSCVDDTLQGEYYPHGAKLIEDAKLARYCSKTKSWRGVNNTKILAWAVQSVDEIKHRGHASERNKASYVESEFPPETVENNKEE